MIETITVFKRTFTVQDPRIGQQPVTLKIRKQNGPNGIMYYLTQSSVYALDDADFLDIYTKHREKAYQKMPKAEELIKRAVERLPDPMNGRIVV